ncbi:PQQ-dependent sugar dehydrogenase [Umezawaea beigongshangensis]|uniref:PQQ-dependent sugar dehydrogenase n=1 Tax=Umezawaea beigongshangensis TaxID=2780383 RepID=UPI0018F23ED2|nr:PQQ-dependent sugar dehydrogenase [Umezawaea beigongshangensis]
MRRLPWVLVALLTAACAPQATGGTAPSSAPVPRGLLVEEVAGGFEHAWDVGVLPDGRMLVTQRPGRLALVDGDRVSQVAADFGDVLVRGEGGLMGMAVHPDFATSREFTTCQTHQEGGTAVDVRLVTWQLSEDGTSARRVADPLLGGLPVNPGGRHSGCRPTVAPDGALLVGTGDAADGSAPQDRSGLGGKVLRIDLETGGAAEGNPFADSADEDERRLLAFGHRNVQGVAVRPGTGQVFTSEHGPDVDDEVNLLRPGGNSGWDPSRGGTAGGYDESVPMTDAERFPDAVPAVWSSGRPTEATCDLAFLTGERWGELEGTLAVTALKGSKLLLFALDEAGAVRSVTIPEELDGTYGRLRAARSAPDGALYVTTSNGSDDKLLRITPGVA